MKFNEQPERRDARQEYESLKVAIDDFVAEVRRHHPEHINCRRGCFLCCVPPETLFRVEGERIREAVSRLPGAVRERIDRRALDPARTLCPLLEDGACVVYEHRPIICRTQGMPLAVEMDDRTYDLDYCRLNFTPVPPGFDLRRRHLLNLDGTNDILAHINLKFVKSAALDPKEDGRVCFKKVAMGRMVSVPTPAGEEETSEVGN